MKIIQMAPDVWVNVGTGAVSRVEVHSDGVTPVIYLNDGSVFNFPKEAIHTLIDTLRSHEQNYERN